MRTNIEANSSFELSKCSKRICNASDGMSLLPDEILVSILSCLTIKEAARTSVLSSRWRFLWTYFKGKMDFVLEDWQIQRDQFVTTMNEILKLHRGTGVERFRIIFDEIHYSVEDFNNWMEFAAKKGVQRFQLMLGSDNSRLHETACNTKPQLRNRLCFKSLQALSLRFIEVNDEAVEYFLTNCANLLRIDLRYSTCLTNILIPSSSHRLKNLCVVGCTNLRKIEIFTRSLEEFVYYGPKISIEVKADFYLLRMVSFGNPRHGSLFEAISQLGRNLPLFQLEHLTLNILFVDKHFISDKYHFTLSKLKTLVLSIYTCTGNEILNCLHLLEATPILHTFTVHFFWFDLRKGPDVFDKHSTRRHQCLKVVKFVNFLGISRVDMQFVKTLIDSVESLEKLIVVPYKNCEWHPITDEMEKSRDRNIKELFENESLGATELIIEEVESHGMFVPL